MTALLEVENLKKHFVADRSVFGRPTAFIKAVDGVSFRVDAGKTLALQPRKSKLLAYLLRHTNQVVTRTMLLENVWDYHFDPQTNVIDVHISKLRQKIDVGFPSALLRMVRNAGYMLTDQP